MACFDSGDARRAGHFPVWVAWLGVVVMVGGGWLLLAL